MNYSSASNEMRVQDGATERAKVLSPQAFHHAIGEAIGKNRVYELLRANRLRHIKVGSRYLILRSEVDDFFVREADRCGGN